MLDYPKITFALLTILLVLATIGHAQEQGNHTTISEQDIQFKRIGEGISDLLFNIRGVFAWTDSAKLDLIEEKVHRLAQRQQEWIAIKSQTNGTVIETIEEVHTDLLEEHASMFSQISRIETEAKAEGDEQTAAKAQALLQRFTSSQIAVGLNVLSTGGTSQVSTSEISATTANETMATATTETTNTSTTQSNEGQMTELNSEQAREIARGYGLEPDTIIKETRSGKTIYIVKGTDEERTIQKSFELIIDAQTGAVTSIKMIESSSTQGGNSSANAQAQVSGTGNVTESSTTTNTQTSPNSVKSTSSAVIKTTGEAASANAYAVSRA